MATEGKAGQRLTMAQQGFPMLRRGPTQSQLLRKELVTGIHAQAPVSHLVGVTMVPQRLRFRLGYSSCSDKQGEGQGDLPPRHLFLSFRPS